MRLLSLGTVASFAATALAFQDTSPFLLFSDYQYDPLAPYSYLANSFRSGSLLQKSIQSSKTVLSATKDFLKSCPSRSYVIIHQPNVGSLNVANVARGVAREASLRLMSQQADYPTLINVGEVAGPISPEEIRDYIFENCGVENVGSDGMLCTK